MIFEKSGDDDELTFSDLQCDKTYKIVYCPNQSRYSGALCVKLCVVSFKLYDDILLVAAPDGLKKIVLKDWLGSDVKFVTTSRQLELREVF